MGVFTHSYGENGFFMCPVYVLRVIPAAWLTSLGTLYSADHGSVLSPATKHLQNPAEQALLLPATGQQEPALCSSQPGQAGPPSQTEARL